ncbi:NTF2-like protein [Venustampulla echinocandica]|uniref:mRNA export factor MEX67 n=1 Tax=Venustampulla echinocandica TaxID=2656787 RepID=A0A370TH19_9HELO|nr:NTF2-like protein [Venustampulla echinocandica]RDL34497.1 NTF2-like protein [Venustampulla echinocandica]
MLKRSSAAPRGSRNTSPSVRGGGIQKRRAGPARVDKDGDLVMDPVAAGGERKSGRGQLGGQKSRARGPGRGSGGPSRGGNAGIIKAQQAIIRGLGAKQANVLESHVTTGGTMARVDGLSSSKAASNPDGGVESLLAFLERKASGLDAKSNRAIKIKKSLKKGDSVIITASPEDIAEIQKLDNFMFAGTTLTIQPYDPSSLARSDKSEDKKKAQVSPSAQETKERLRGILATRYDAALKLLDLSALAQDEGLKQMGVFDGSTTTSKIFPALMVVCDGLFKTRQEKRDAIVSVTLADNNLADVSDVAALAQTFPDLKNLDLSRNRLEQLSSLDAWRSKLRHLSNLVLIGNPIESQLPTIKTEIMRRYPYLEVLNGVQIRTPDEIAAAVEAAKSPIPIATPDFRDVGQVGENFIRQFVVLYDNDRPQLLATFYDMQSVLSISVNMQAPRNPKNSVPIPPWASYTKHSRNLVKINNLPTQMSRMHRGSQAIQSVWATLPATRHPDLQSQPEKYLIECHPLPGLADPNNQSIRGVDGLIVTMHGEFEEQNDSTEQALRSFSRTFVLGPGAPGGPPIRVVSDMMVLRAWGPLALPRSSPIAPETPQGNPEQQKQQAIAMQLVERTGMTPNYAMLCLTETGWDLEQAFIAFTANKDKLPPDAFIAGATR